MLNLCLSDEVINSDWSLKQVRTSKQNKMDLTILYFWFYLVFVDS